MIRSQVKLVPLPNCHLIQNNSKYITKMLKINNDLIHTTSSSISFINTCPVWQSCPYWSIYTSFIFFKNPGTRPGYTNWYYHHHASKIFSYVFIVAPAVEVLCFKTDNFDTQNKRKSIKISMKFALRKNITTLYKIQCLIKPLG